MGRSQAGKSPSYEQLIQRILNLGWSYKSRLDGLVLLQAWNCEPVAVRLRVLRRCSDAYASRLSYKVTVEAALAVYGATVSPFTPSALFQFDLRVGGLGKDSNLRVLPNKTVGKQGCLPLFPIGTKH